MEHITDSALWQPIGCTGKRKNGLRRFIYVREVVACTVLTATLFLAAPLQAQISTENVTTDIGGLFHKMRPWNGKLVVLMDGTPQKLSVVEVPSANQIKSVTTASMQLPGNNSCTVEDFTIYGNTVYTVGNKNGIMYLGEASLTDIQGSTFTYTTRELPTAIMMGSSAGDTMQHYYTFRNPHRVEVFKGTGGFHAMVLCEILDQTFTPQGIFIEDTVLQAAVDFNLAGGANFITSTNRTFDDIVITDNYLTLSVRDTSANRIYLWPWYLIGFNLGDTHANILVKTFKSGQTRLLKMTGDEIAMSCYRYNNNGTATDKLVLCHAHIHDPLGYPTIESVTSIYRESSYVFYDWCYLPDTNALCLLEKCQLQSGSEAQAVNLIYNFVYGSTISYYKSEVDMVSLCAYDDTRFIFAGTNIAAPADRHFVLQKAFDNPQCETSGNNITRRFSVTINETLQTETRYQWSCTTTSYTLHVSSGLISNICYY